MRPPTATSAAPAIARDLHEALVELAIAVQKRAIYPPQHPVLRGAVEGVQARFLACLAAGHDLAFAVADRQLVVDGVSTDARHPHLGDLAGRLTAHEVGLLAIAPGVTQVELAELVSALSQSREDEIEPLGRCSSTGWAHVRIEGMAFDRLALAGDSNEQTPADKSWEALARGLLTGAFTGEAGEPESMARLLGAAEHFGDDLLDRIERAFQDAGGGEGRARLGRLVSGVEGCDLARLLAAAGVERTTRILEQATSALPADALLHLVRAAAEANGAGVSTATLRMLQKMSAPAAGRTARGDRAIRRAMQRLMEGWHLASPNPDAYEKALVEAARPNARGSDQRRDDVEPERIIDLAIETGAITKGSETALARLVHAQGLARALDFLGQYPESSTRELLVDRLLNESSLREHMAQPVLDVPLLRHAVERMRARAVAPLVDALDRRAEGDAAVLCDLIQRIGWDALEPIGARMGTVSVPTLRQLVGICSALEAWPPQVDPMVHARHADPLVRRDALKFLLKVPAARDEALLLTLRDSDARVLGMGIMAVGPVCPEPVARELMRRCADPGFGGELRLKAIRLVGTCRTADVAVWLVGLVPLTRRWWVFGTTLGRPGAEALEAVRALAEHPGGATVGRQVLDLSRRSPLAVWRKAASRAGEGTSHA